MKVIHCGYEIKQGNSDPNTVISGLKAGSINTTVDDMHFKVITYNKYYWLSSASNRTVNTLWCVGYNADLTFGAYTTGWAGRGFRPLVCLKSDVHLLKNADGETYSLELD